MFVDGKDYSKNEFDFRKIDAEEARKDEVAVKEGFDPNKFSSKFNRFISFHFSFMFKFFTQGRVII